MPKPFELTQSEQVAYAFRGSLSLDEAVAKFRTDLCIATVKLEGGNRNRAAALLGVHRNTLYRWLDEGIPVPVDGRNENAFGRSRRSA